MIDDLYTALTTRIMVGADHYIQPWWLILVGVSLAASLAHLIKKDYLWTVINFAIAVFMIWPLSV